MVELKHYGKMKTLLLLPVTLLAILMALAGAETPKIDWNAMSAEAIRERVRMVGNIREVTELLGQSRSSDNNADWSEVRYTLSAPLILIFVAEPENHFSKTDDLRKVLSIYLYRKDPNGHLQVVWKFFKDPVHEQKIRSDYFDLPTSSRKTK